MRKAAFGIIYFGEGSYEQSEMIIQQLLAEAGAAEVSNMTGVG